MNTSKHYNLSATEALLQKCMDYDYEFIQVSEGVLGHGHMILLSHREGYFNFEIEEKYLNEWSSTHKIRRFNIIGKRVQKLIDEAHARGEGVEVRK